MNTTEVEDMSPAILCLIAKVIALNDARAQPNDSPDRLHRVAEHGSGVNFFHLDCLSSKVRLKVDLDTVLTALANGCYRWLASQLHGFDQTKPKGALPKVRGNLWRG